jgi:hypothetical protein
VKPLVEISIAHYESLLKYASETSPLYLRLKNAVKTEANTIAILCDLGQAQMLRAVAKHFFLAAVPQIEKAIRLNEFPNSLPPDLPQLINSTRGKS